MEDIEAITIAWIQGKLGGFRSDFVIKHIVAETKWTPFRRQQFQMDFLEWKLLYFASNFTEIFSQGV